MSSSPLVRSRGAAVPFVPPPLYYAAGLVGGALLDREVAAPLGGRPVTSAVGAAVVAAGLALAVGGVAGVVRHRTTIVPHHPVSALVRVGAYRLSRNPMYAGLGIAYLGAALLIGSWWPMVLWPAVMVAVDRLVVRREERYLAQRFSAQYADYCARVRRWL